tara:strand:- start:38 stop:1135 length:1098 start_codon:yes stop_codon:yes gene_type:complete
MSILNTFASKLFPEGDFQNIRANAPDQMSYNIDATRDLVQNQPFNPLAPAMALTFSLPYDTIQGIGRAFKNVKSEPGILDYDNIPNDITFADIGKSIAAENPFDSLIGRTYGATLGLGDKLKSYGKTISDAIISPAYAAELDDIESIIEARKNREELNRRGLMALDDAGLNTAAMVDEFSQTSKPRFDLRNFLTDVKDKGIDMLGSGKELAFRGIGNLIAGPVGGFIGGAIGKMKTTPEQRLLKDFYEKETGLDSIGRIQGGIMQGYNPVSMFGPQGLTSAIDKRLATILKTEQKKKAKGLELSKKLIERRKQLEELKRKEEQARVDATRRMAQENRAAGTGGYQAGYDRDFMGGSGTAADMGSF